MNQRENLHIYIDLRFSLAIYLSVLREKCKPWFYSRSRAMWIMVGLSHFLLELCPRTTRRWCMGKGNRWLMMIGYKKNTFRTWMTFFSLRLISFSCSEPSGKTDAPVLTKRRQWAISDEFSLSCFLSRLLIDIHERQPDALLCISQTSK